MGAIKTYTIETIINKLRDGDITIPDWHRNAHWTNDCIETLFYNIFVNNSLGEIVVTKNITRLSRKLGENVWDKSNYNSQLLVVDGYKRLHAIYQSIINDIKDVKLYFYMLFGNGTESLPFKFFHTANPPKCADWVSVNWLYKQIQNHNKEYVKVVEDLNQNNNSAIQENLFKFYYHFFFAKRITLFFEDEIEDKAKTTFVNLNSYGINLQKQDIFSCLLRSLGRQFETLIDETIIFLPIDDLKERNWAYIKDDFKGKFSSISSIIYYIYYNGEKTNISDSNAQLNWLLDESDHIKDFFDCNILKQVIEKCFALMYITPIRIYVEPQIALFFYKELKKDYNRNLLKMFKDYIVQKFEHFFVSQDDARIFADIYAIEAANCNIHQIEFFFCTDCNKEIRKSVEKENIYDFFSGKPSKAQDKSIAFCNGYPKEEYKKNKEWLRKEAMFNQELKQK